MKRKIARIENQKTGRSSAPLGYAGLDAAIGGGLARGRLHEVFARELADNSSAAGFAAMLACLASQEGAPLFWLREERAARRQGLLHAPGLTEIGIDPRRMVLIMLPDPVALLRAAVDVVRCASIGAVVIELWRRPRALDLTASRRLALAAEASGVTPLLLRIEAEPGPSAAQTRWSVSAAPSVALEAEAPGRPAFNVKLLRQRGRPDGGCWHLEWDRDRACFGDATLSGAVVSTTPGRSLVQDAWRQAG
ncbi:ImuA family protein [Croceibacterium atlanticum]|uniref:ImuA family protein n=1 Tax=Croceibacterium atlanticum TaxID=1267766 RepID=UPI001FD2F11E|nr:hypothetical protein [Croceibacterium atlanticum]